MEEAHLGRAGLVLAQWLLCYEAVHASQEAVNSLYVVGAPHLHAQPPLPNPTSSIFVLQALAASAVPHEAGQHPRLGPKPWSWRGYDTHQEFGLPSSP